MSLEIDGVPHRSHHGSAARRRRGGLPMLQLHPSTELPARSRQVERRSSSRGSGAAVRRYTARANRGRQMERHGACSSTASRRANTTKAPAVAGACGTRSALVKWWSLERHLLGPSPSSKLRTRQSAIRATPGKTPKPTRMQPRVNSVDTPKGPSLCLVPGVWGFLTVRFAVALLSTSLTQGLQGNRMRRFGARGQTA